MHFSHSIVLALASLAIASPVPDPDNTVSDLDVSSLELDDSLPEADNRPLEIFKRAISCRTPDGCHYSDADNLANNIIARRTETYAVGSDWRSIMAYGTCRVWGRGSTSSYARDVGYGLQDIERQCNPATSGDTRGYGAAGGNGNFQLYLGYVNGKP